MAHCHWAALAPPEVLVDTTEVAAVVADQASLVAKHSYQDYCRLLALERRSRHQDRHPLVDTGWYSHQDQPGMECEEPGLHLVQCG